MAQRSNNNNSVEIAENSTRLGNAFESDIDKSLELVSDEEYIGYLSSSFDSDSMITNANFSWKNIDGTDYNNTINADYDTGITPYKIKNTSDGSSVETVVAFAHNVEMPYYTSSDSGNIKVNYDSEETEALKKQFQKDDFSTSLQNKINAMATSLYNKTATNQNFVFNKTKKNPLDLEDVKGSI